jgi:hypothetical protein
MPSYLSDYIDIDPEEYLSDCNDSEIKEIIEILQDWGDIPSLSNNNGNSSNYEVNDAIKKISISLHNLTPQQEKTLIELGNQLILHSV